MWQTVKEFFNPALKCQTNAHVPRSVVRRGLIPTTSSMSVAERVTQRRIVCKNCKALMTEWEIVEFHAFVGSLSMPESDWYKFEKNGFI